MRKRTKTVRGQLLDFDNKSILVEKASVEITLILYPGSVPSYKATMMLDDYKPELFVVNNRHTLKLETISGAVILEFLSDGIPSEKQDPYKVKVLLQGSEWLNLEWFDSLHTID